MALGENFFDGGLAEARKVEGDVELVLVDLAQAEHGASEWAAVASLSWRAVASLAAGSMIRATIMATISLARRSGPFGSILLSPSRRSPEHGGDVAMRQRTGDLGALGGERNTNLSGEHPAQALDLGLRPIGDVGERARLDLAALAIAFAQQDGGRRIADGMRVTYMISLNHGLKLKSGHRLHAYNPGANPRNPAQTLAFPP